MVLGAGADPSHVNIPPLRGSVVPATQRDSGLSILSTSSFLKYQGWRPFPAYKDDVYLLPKLPDEKAATSHLHVLGAALTVLTQEHTLNARTPEKFRNVSDVKS